MLENVSLILKLVLESMGFCKVTIRTIANDDVYLLDDRKRNLNLHNYVHDSVGNGSFQSTLEYTISFRVVRT